MISSLSEDMSSYEIISVLKLLLLDVFKGDFVFTESLTISISRVFSMFRIWLRLSSSTEVKCDGDSRKWLSRHC